MTLSMVYKVIRFCIVGGLASFIYFIATHIILNQTSFDAVYASIMAYLIAIPFSFLGQKYFTFKANGNPFVEMTLFLVSHLLGLIVSTAVVFLSNAMELNINIGLFAVIILVPVINFIFMNTIVFKHFALDKKTT